MMSLFLHICTGLGLALAAGIRPFTPVLAAGGLARARATFGFSGTHYAFLRRAGSCSRWRPASLPARWCGRRRFANWSAAPGSRWEGSCSPACSPRHHDASWPGLLGGAVAAGIALYASRPIFDGASARLGDGAAVLAVLLYADAAALVVALACWFAGPLSLAVARLPREPGLGAAWTGPGAARSTSGAALKKLVLAVIDGARPAMIEEAVADGHAPSSRDADRARQLQRRGGRGVSLGHARLLGHDRHGPRPGPPPDPVDELVSPRRRPATSSTARAFARRCASASAAS